MSPGAVLTLFALAVGAIVTAGAAERPSCSSTERAELQRLEASYAAEVGRLQDAGTAAAAATQGTYGPSYGDATAEAAEVAADRAVTERALQAVAASRATQDWLTAHRSCTSDPVAAPSSAPARVAAHRACDRFGTGSWWSFDTVEFGGEWVGTEPVLLEGAVEMAADVARDAALARQDSELAFLYAANQAMQHLLHGDRTENTHASEVMTNACDRLRRDFPL